MFSDTRRSLFRRFVFATILIASAWIVLIAVPSSRAATTTVDIASYAYTPATVTIAVGDTVTWTNRDGAPHDAKDVDNKPPTFGTPILSMNESGSVQFNTPGTFNYYCSVHPFMRGVVVVQAGPYPFTEHVYLPTVNR